MKSPKQSPGEIPQPATVPPKRKPGQPTRTVPRTRSLPRVTQATHARLSAYAAAHHCYLADAIEAAAAALDTQPNTSPQKAIHRAPMMKMVTGAQVGRDKLWETRIDPREVEVLAIVKGYAMVRRPKCIPYVCPAKEIHPKI